MTRKLLAVLMTVAMVCLLIPVGGTYTLDAAGAKQVCDAIAPKWVVPMHYHHGTYGFPVLLEVEDFLNLWPAFTRVEGSELTIDGNTAGVNVLTFA
jgi:L-ascorbate metabolism protein UlaG (beta-lactamase superfamily)